VRTSSAPRSFSTRTSFDRHMAGIPQTAAVAAAAEAAAYEQQPIKLAIGTFFDRPPPLAPLGEPQLVQLTFEQLESVLHVAGVPQDDRYRLDHPAQAAATEHK